MAEPQDSSFIFALVAIIGFPLIHGLCMWIDWKLRDPEAPSTGGLSDQAISFFQWGSLICFGTVAFLALGRVEVVVLRLTFSMAATGVAFLLMCLGWFGYIVGKGIDTL